MKFNRYLTPLALTGCMTVGAFADSIDPDVVIDTIDVGEKLTIRKTVTVNEGGPRDAVVDVFFLFDTTSSMGTTLSAAAGAAGDIATSLGILGDVNFGVGHYEDFPLSPFGSIGNVPYIQDLDLTSDSTALSTALSGLSPFGGFDGPESNLTGLTAAATGDGTVPGEGPASWRDGSTRVIVWFGDAPGHEGDEAGYPGTATTASTITALDSEGITVHAIDVGALNSTGQATAITDATGGDLFAGLGGDVAGTILDAVSGTFDEYSMVSLDLSGIPAGLDAEVVAIGPTADGDKHTGMFDRSEDRMFEFDLMLTGVAEGIYGFDVPALVDGGIVAVETDRITVGEGGGSTDFGVVPEPITASLGIMGLGALTMASSRRR